MYKIFIKDLKFDTIIGLLDFEREERQSIIVDFEASYEYNDNFIDYVEIKNIIVNEIKTKEYKLLEYACSDLSNILQNRFKSLKKIKLSITKPNILNDCIVGVSIET